MPRENFFGFLIKVLSERADTPFATSLPPLVARGGCAMPTVTWRQAVAAIVATVLGLVALVIVVSSDGLPAVDATSSRAVRWFVHQPTGRVVLADGFGGRALASLEVETTGGELTVAEGAAGSSVAKKLSESSSRRSGSCSNWDRISSSSQAFGPGWRDESPSAVPVMHERLEQSAK